MVITCRQLTAKKNLIFYLRQKFNLFFSNFLQHKKFGTCYNGHPLENMIYTINSSHQVVLIIVFF